MTKGQTMAADYVRKTVEALAVLPPEKQLEVYDFAAFLNASCAAVRARPKERKGSVLNLIAMGRSGIRDISDRHDHYVYDE